MTDAAASSSDGELAQESRAAAEPAQPPTELVEVFPDVVAVLGEIPTEFQGLLEPLNSGLLSAVDHDHVARALAVLGNGATVGGNLAHAAAGMRGLYKINEGSQALLDAGGRLAVKDGWSLGTILPPKGSGQKIAQARFTPAASMTAAQAAGAIGPAVAMIALQVELNRISALVDKNIELTTQIIESTRRTERATLMSLVDMVDRALDDARSAGSVPRSLWDTIASKKVDLDAQRRTYRDKVDGHIRRVSDGSVRQRRDYLQTNARTIVFDSFALLATMKAWTGYQALAAAVARDAGADDPAEAKHFDSIVAATRRDLEDDLGEATRLIGALTRELHIAVELPGPATVRLTSKRKDADAARGLAQSVLTAIAPLADSLVGRREPLQAPEVLCVPTGSELEPYLKILPWLLEPTEHVRCLGIGVDAHARGAVAAVVEAAKDKIASSLDRNPDRQLLVVTNRRILTGDTQTFLQRAVFRHDVRLDDVRYVRSTPAANNGSSARIDLITRGHNHAWRFEAQSEAHEIDALAAVLAEFMTLPEAEREELRRRAGVEQAGLPALPEGDTDTDTDNADSHGLETPSSC